MILLEKEPKLPKNIYNPNLDPADLKITGNNTPYKKVELNPYQAQFDNARTVKQKEKVIEDYIKQLPNYNNIKYAQEVIANSIFYSGFDPENNPFLYYILHFKGNNLTANVADLIRTLIVDENINIGNARFDWLYRKDTYQDKNENAVLFKIKALTYASNPNLQRGASEKITINTFMDGAYLKTAAEMRKVLDQITITDDVDYTIGDFITYRLTAEGKRSTVQEVRRILDTTIQIVFRSTAEKAAKAEIDRILNRRNISTKGLEEIIKNLSDVDIVSLNNVNIEGLQSPKEFKTNLGKIAIAIVQALTNKAQEDTDEKEKKRAEEKEVKRQEKEQDAINTKGYTGAQILSQTLNTNALTRDAVHNYIKDNLIDSKDSMRVIKQGIIDTGVVDLAIEKLLKQRYISSMGVEPIELLNDALIDALDKATTKNFRSKKGSNN